MLDEKAIREDERKKVINDDVLARFDKVKTDLLFANNSLSKSQTCDAYQEVIEELRRMAGK